MSKPVKEMMRRELVRRFDGVRSLAVVEFTGLDAVTTHEVRGRLLEKDIRITVVKNSVARRAFRELGLAPAAELLDGPCAVAYGTSADVEVVSMVRTLLAIGKDAPQLTVKAALLEGEVFGPDRIEELSTYPTRDEAMSGLAAMVLSPGRNVVGCLLGPAGVLASMLKTIKDKAAEASPQAVSPPQATAEEQ
ncbi:MAG TPA: 50S ribosomal protein L10 [Phycisphaerae bacterium]|nr:50S ribosomal protein L10 [Phycisphaerae bacterium]